MRAESGARPSIALTLRVNTKITARQAYAVMGLAENPLPTARQCAYFISSATLSTFRSC
jgi:hypothetical protein